MNSLLRGLLRHVYMDQAGDGAGEGGSGAQGGDAAAAGAQAGAADQAANAASGGDSAAQANAEGDAGNESAANVLAGAAGESAQAVQVQEKYLVKDAEGNVDWEKSALKQAEGYQALSKRLGSPDAPPKSADDYTVTVPDDMKEALGDLKTDPLVQEFLKDAHAAGMSQKQVDIGIGKYLQLAPELVSGNQQLSADECVAELKQTWKTDAEYNAGLKSAFTAAQGYFGDDAQGIINTYGNDPRIIRGLAKIGKEMGEDASLNTEGLLSGGITIEELHAHPAYTDPKHPEHLKISKQVNAYYAALEKKQAA